MDAACSQPLLYPSLSMLYLFIFALSPDSVQLPVVSIMKEVVEVEGSGGARWRMDKGGMCEKTRRLRREGDKDRGDNGKQDSGTFGLLSIEMKIPKSSC